MFSESELFNKYTPFIHKCVNEYYAKYPTLRRSDIIDDLFSEASIAFLDYVRKHGIKTLEITRLDSDYIKRAMRWKMKLYISDYFGNSRHAKGDIDLFKSVSMTDLVNYEAGESEENLFETYQMDETVDDVEYFMSQLDPREQFIIKKLDEGYHNYEIAMMLGLSVKTIDTIRSRLKIKFKNYYQKED